jgi:hypothetical protein
MLEEGLGAPPERRRGNFVFVIKSFATVFVAIREGRVAPRGARPRRANGVSHAGELLAADDEESLPEFLQEGARGPAPEII